MSRTEQALEVLKSGGFFRKQLETQYRGGEKFVTRLRDNSGHVVKGVGIKTFFELEDAGCLSHRPCLSSSTWPSEYVLREAA